MRRSGLPTYVGLLVLLGLVERGLELLGVRLELLLGVAPENRLRDSSLLGDRLPLVLHLLLSELLPEFRDRRLLIGDLLLQVPVVGELRPLPLEPRSDDSVELVLGGDRLEAAALARVPVLVAAGLVVLVAGGLLVGGLLRRVRRGPAAGVARGLLHEVERPETGEKLQSMCVHSFPPEFGFCGPSAACGGRGPWLATA